MNSVPDPNSMSKSNFDINNFNADFELSSDLSKMKSNQLDEARLNKLNESKPPTPLYDLSISQILIGIKDAWFDLIDDLLQQRFSIDTFVRNNKLFYIGLTIIIVILILYLYDVFTNSETVNTNKVVEIHHVYHGKNIIPGAENTVALRPSMIETPGTSEE
jgi:hypothetical protein